MNHRFKELHAMCDIETLSLASDGPVLEVSFSVFTLEKPPVYEEMVSEAASFMFNVDDQIQNCRRLPQAGTMLWWMTKTSPEAQKNVLNRSLSCKLDNAETLLQIAHFLSHVDHVWCRGPHFDAAALISMCNDYGVPELWKFYKTRDIRTLLYTLDAKEQADKFKADMEKSGEFIKHDSAHDTAIDAFLIAQLMRDSLLQQHGVANVKGKRK